MRKIDILHANGNESIWLIDSNFVGLMRFYKDKEHSDKSICLLKRELMEKSSIIEN